MLTSNMKQQYSAIMFCPVDSILTLYTEISHLFVKNVDYDDGID